MLGPVNHFAPLDRLSRSALRVRRGRPRHDRSTITAIARMIPSSCAIFASWRQVDEPDVREGNRERCVSDFTLRRLSKKTGHVGDEKAPAIDGRGKLAERLEVEFGPSRSAASR